MKKGGAIILILLLLGTIANAQRSKNYFSYSDYYYNYSNGIQMVEIVFYVSDLTVYRYTTMNTAWVINDPNPRIYIFRNVDGKIISAYNLCGARVEDFNLIPPALVNPSALKCHQYSRYSIFENCSIKSSAGYPFVIGGKYANADLSNAKYGAIDTMGNIIIRPQYDMLWVATKKNILAAKQNTKYGIMDENGKTILPFIYDNLECYSYNGGTFRLERQHKFSYADSAGRIFTKHEYDFCELFWSRRARVAMQGKYGFIDSTGTEVVPLIYDKAEAFYYNVAIVGTGNKFGMINNLGEIIEPIEYDRITDIYDEKKMITTGYKGYKNGQIIIFDLRGKKAGK